MRRFFHYERDNRRRPVVTHCVLFDEDTGLFSMGTAVCSKKDQPVKRVGRQIAEGRAKKAKQVAERNVFSSANAVFAHARKTRFIKQASGGFGHVFPYLPPAAHMWAKHISLPQLAKKA